VEVQLNAFLTSELDGGEWSVSRLGRFTPRETAPGTYWIGELYRRSHIVNASRSERWILNTDQVMHLTTSVEFMNDGFQKSVLNEKAYRHGCKVI
jgi:hypothetical protein